MPKLIQLHLRVANRVMYKNWKGDIRERVIKPLEIYFGSTEYHPEDQWLLRAEDLEKGEIRDFSLKDMEIIPWPK